MTKTTRRDEQLRNMPDNYVDPARRLARKHRPKRNPPRKVITPPLASGKPNVAASTSIVESEPYPKHMKMGIMLLAVQDGVPETARQFDIPERTIYGWFKQEGGLNAVREFAQAAAENSFTKLIQKACDELYSRMEAASDDELFESFRKMLATAEGAGLSGVGGAKRRGRESESGPQDTPRIVLQINAPPALPAGSSSQGNEGTPPDDAVEGEVLKVFDE